MKEAAMKLTHIDEAIDCQHRRPLRKRYAAFLGEWEGVHFQRFDVQEWMCKSKHIWNGHKCDCKKD
jgi:hypothetical protein